ncbi:hypothetical protein FE257_011080 [Aspergillus nanangensis]|uniref:Uncharacterized protein n=1 Tax=Aspergillus nanangensis TaxID=2582783 RepID=A0AAD4CJB9_ASPNN|nr:hypothetical protein FE257_011080 [Aspergillus nanangensis]
MRPFHQLTLNFFLSWSGTYILWRSTPVWSLTFLLPRFLALSVATYILFFYDPFRGAPTVKDDVGGCWVAPVTWSRATGRTRASEAAARNGSVYCGEEVVFVLPGYPPELWKVSYLLDQIEVEDAATGWKKRTCHWRGLGYGSVGSGDKTK